MVSELLIVDSVDGQSRAARVLSLAWAECLCAQIEIAEDSERQYKIVLSALESGDYDYPPDEERAFRRVWTNKHAVIWMASQLAQWLRHVVDMDDGSVFGRDLKILRNALEHLDEALIDGSIAKANPEGQANQSIASIPGGIHIGSIGARVLLEIDLCMLKNCAVELLQV